MKIQPLASGSKGNCYLIEDDCTSLLVECGITIRRIREGLNFKLRGISATLISHEHSDHGKAVEPLLRMEIDCWMSRGTAGRLLLPHMHSHHRLHFAMSGQRFEVGTFAVMPFSTVHDAAEPLGFLLASGRGKLLYATDTACIPARFSGLTHIMIECNYQEQLLMSRLKDGKVDPALDLRVRHSHMSQESVCKFLGLQDLSLLCEVWLLHISAENVDIRSMTSAIRSVVNCPVFVA